MEWLKMLDLFSVLQKRLYQQLIVTDYNTATIKPDFHLYSDIYCNVYIFSVLYAFNIICIITYMFILTV